MHLVDRCFRTTATLTEANAGLSRIDRLLGGEGDSIFADQMTRRLPRMAEQSGRRLSRTRRASVYDDAIERPPSWTRAPRRADDDDTLPLPMILSTAGPERLGPMPERHRTPYIWL